MAGKHFAGFGPGDNLDGQPPEVKPLAESLFKAIPDDSWKVADIKAWLDAQGIAYVGNALKADLLALV